MATEDNSKATPIDIESLPITVRYVGETVKDDNWKCFQWAVQIKTKAGVWDFPYYCGMGHVTKPAKWRTWKPKAPSKADIMHILLADADFGEYSFNDFCSEAGYSNDSLKALDAYRACTTTAENIRKHFDRATIEQLREQLQDH